jgi:hypothetical protein
MLRHPVSSGWSCLRDSPGIQYEHLCVYDPRSAETVAQPVFFSGAPITASSESAFSVKGPGTPSSGIQTCVERSYRDFVQQLLFGEQQRQQHVVGYVVKIAIHWSSSVGFQRSGQMIIRRSCRHSVLSSSPSSSAVYHLKVSFRPLSFLTF